MGMTQHLQNKKKCLELIQQVYLPLDVSIVKELDKAALVLKQPGVRVMPAKRGDGPRVSVHLASEGKRAPTALDVALVQS